MDNLDGLKAAQQPITPTDSMSDAGRKALLADFITMLEHEAGSRSGDGSEDVHDMRVATRRMRSAFRLLREYYKPKAIDLFQRRLRKLARALGSVRDLDVLLSDLSAYRESLLTPQKPKKTRGRKAAPVAPAAAGESSASDGAAPALTSPPDALNSVITLLQQRRELMRADLLDLLDSKSYRVFTEKFAAFLIEEDSDAGKDAPYAVNLTVPNLIFDRLAAVRAYDTAIENADSALLHQLRVEFKRLRYAVSYFRSVLGTQIDLFVEELKRIQDHLGRLNDAVVAQAELTDLLDELEPEAQAALQGYIDQLATEEQRLKSEFGAVWARFNSRDVQQIVGAAVAGI